MLLLSLDRRDVDDEHNDDSVFQSSACRKATFASVLRWQKDLTGQKANGGHDRYAEIPQACASHGWACMIDVYGSLLANTLQCHKSTPISGSNALGPICRQYPVNTANPSVQCEYAVMLQHDNTSQHALARTQHPTS